jgi:16S rRNA (uracil1498-N3)-methyltransferase
MHRFFVTSDCFEGEMVTFKGDLAHQIKHVLRLRVGQAVVVLDNRGSAYDVTLETVEGPLVEGRVTAHNTAGGEPRAWLHLYLGLAQREKFEWMLQKCTEVGACAFTPLITSRSLAQGRAEAARKYPRWESILREAAEQCGRGRIPELHPPLLFKESLRETGKLNHLTLLAWEGEHSLFLKQALQGLKNNQETPPRLACFIGPEGGFSEDEVSLARAAGVITVSLGERVLRMETAAVVTTALILYELE